jgi:hypothetical protein
MFPGLYLRGWRSSEPRSSWTGRKSTRLITRLNKEINNNYKLLPYYASCKKNSEKEKRL